MKMGPELLQDIKMEIDLLEPEADGYIDPAVTDLKLKYATLIVLQDIHNQLFEISHYGIGTD